ncbi:MAG: hypothetical protein HN348_04640 [Proteobacteria bacterium]|nr:hypothetical protein [Pseudomonadota bacterium]
MRCYLPLFLALLSSPALAGGYFYSDSGIVATGRGGAIIASTDNQFAQYYNPAGLIRVEAPTFNIGWSFVQQNIKFDRLNDEDGTFYPAVKNEAPPYNVPQIGFATPINKWVAIAFGFTSPFAPSALYDEDGPQRYTIIDTEIYQFSITPAIAVRPIKQLTIGAGFQWKYMGIGERLKITMSGNDDPGGDIVVDARLKDLFTPSFTAGVLVEPIEALSIGLSVQPPVSFETKGTGELDFSGNVFESLIEPPNPDDCEDPDDLEACPRIFTDDDVTMTIDLPLVLRGGVAVRPIKPLEIEFAVVYQAWKVLEDIVVKDINIEVVSALGPAAVDEELALPASFRDTTSFRLGAEYDVIKQLSVRMGGFYETGALKTEDLSVALVDPSKYQIGAGATVRLLQERLIFDIGAAYLAFTKQEIRNSNVSQINAGVFNDDVAVVGNGDIKANGWLLGAQVSWAMRNLGKKKKAIKPKNVGKHVDEEVVEEAESVPVEVDEVEVDEVEVDDENTDAEAPAKEEPTEDQP